MDDIKSKSKFVFLEEDLKILKYWNEIDAFQRSLDLTKDYEVYSFYDGPPFATGTPHYGHILASTVKDIIPRYATMNKKYVERRFGWDTHGLPVEYEIDKLLGIQSKNDVLKMGIDNYNSHCRSIVMRYATEWRKTINQLGRWIDMDNDYKTLNIEFMESVWWVFKELFKKGSIYRGLKVMPYLSKCHTSLSNFEAQQNYKDVFDPAVYVTFPILGDEKSSFVVWTTTPWTLPANLALAINENFEYGKFYHKERNEYLILLDSLIEGIYNKKEFSNINLVEKIKGKDLVGIKYVPLFDYFYDEYKDVAFKVISADYVTNDSGTGIVHQAPLYGEDDYNTLYKEGIISENKSPSHIVDESGYMNEKAKDFKGLYFKDSDKLIIKAIQSKGRLLLHTQIKHSYPFCWRSDTPLMYKALPSWFVRVVEIIPDMLKNIKNSNWVPLTIKEKRFLNWVANAKDWNISRNRFWGTPIPLWVSEDFEEVCCVGSIQELKELSGCNDITDLHRENIDSIVIPSKKGNKPLKRIDEVFDCWFESGSMPYASIHYPFENKDKFKNSFPVDFISEGLDQTRGWFYTLSIIGTHLFNKVPFKNVIVSGIILSSSGKKMSKRLKNYTDPSIIMSEYGADALRLYLINSSVLKAESLKFKDEGVREIVTSIILPWYNSFNFFNDSIELFNNENNLNFKYDGSLKLSNIMDKWILSSLQSLIRSVKQQVESYKLYTIVPKFLLFIDDLTNLYIRFNRRRLKGYETNDIKDTQTSLNTLLDVLFTFSRIMAPFTPFLAENIYGKIKDYYTDDDFRSFYLNPKVLDKRSIHFLVYPSFNEKYSNLKIEISVSRMKKVIELVRNIREQKCISLKTPLKKLVILHNDIEFLNDINSLKHYLQSELNVREIYLTSEEDEYKVKYYATADWPVLGKKLKHSSKKIKEKLPNISSNEIKRFLIEGKITIDDIELVKEDLQVFRCLSDDFSNRDLESRSNNDLMVILDVKIYENYAEEALAKEIKNRIQKLRKKSGLKTIDQVQVEYLIKKDTFDFKKVIKNQSLILNESTKFPLKEFTDHDADKLIITEEQKINDTIFDLKLLRI